MKIKVKDLEANPYRNIGKYPIDRSKVESLKISIKETTFWDNILVRPGSTKGKYQIAYGHHRHIAIKECGLAEIDVPCRSLTNAQMLKIMAEENLEWSTSPAIINETVLAAKKFLDDELAKCEYATSDKSIRCLFTGKTAYTETKTKGVGRETILKFLGDNWKQWMIQAALAVIESDKLSADKGGVDRKAVEILPTIEAANKFRGEMKNHKIPKPVQRRIAKKIVTEGIGTRDIVDTIREVAKPEHLSRVKKKAMPTLDKFVENMLNPMRNVQHDLIKIKPNMDDIQSLKVRRQLLRECNDLMKVLQEIISKEQKDVKKTG